MRKRFKVVLGSMATFFVASPAFLAWSVDLATDRQAAKARADLAALGYPITLKDVLARAPLPADNSWPLYETLIDSMGEAERKVPLYETIIPNREIPKLDAVRAFVDRIDVVKTRPAFWPPRAYDKPIRETTELQDVDHLAKMVARTAVLDAKRGDKARSLSRFETLSAIASHLSRDPLLNGGMFGLRVFQDRNRAMLQAAVANRDPAFRAALRTAILNHPADFQPTRHAAMEAVLVANYHGYSEPVAPGYRIEHQMASLPWMIRRWRAAQLEHWAAVAELGKDGLSEEDMGKLDQLNLSRRDDPITARAWAEAYIPGSQACVEGLAELETVTLAALDRLSSANLKIPDGLDFEARREYWAIVGTRYFVMVGPREVRLGTSPMWRGFGP